MIIINYYAYIMYIAAMPAFLLLPACFLAIGLIQHSAVHLDVCTFDNGDMRGLDAGVDSC